MPIGIADGQCPLKPRFSIRDVYSARRDECKLAGAQSSFCIADVRRNEIRLPLENVTRSRIRRVRTAVAGRHIFEELHSGTRGCALSRLRFAF